MFAGSDVRLNVTQSEFINNIALGESDTVNGGVVSAVEDVYIMISYCQFINNTACTRICMSLCSIVTVWRCFVVREFKGRNCWK